jgi:NAD(P)-dependent dehydrogenase (short-subunit alcohol dehydrogenase family)
LEHSPDLLTRRNVLALAAATAAAGLSGCTRPPHNTEVIVPERRRFQNKVIVVTGATSGIGRAAAIAFAAEGGKVGFCGRRQNLGHDVEAEIRSKGGDALYVPADIRVETDVKHFIERVVSHFGQLNVAFNNAGITLEKPVHEYTLAEWDDVNNTNLRGAFLSMKYEIPHLLKAGSGNIVVTASSNAIATEPRRAAYSASKRGLIGLVQAAALDYGSQGIRVNALIPGTTNTALVRRSAGMENVPDAVWNLAAAQWGKSHVLAAQRMATPEEIAMFALTLASEEHPYMTGAQMVIDGGKTAHAG